MKISIPFLKASAGVVFLLLLHLKSTAQDRVQCDTSNIPTGWVIVDVKKCTCCDAAEPQKQFTIRKIDLMPLGSTVNVCAADKLPDGWLVNSKSVCPCCNPDGENGTQYIIKRIK